MDTYAAQWIGPTWQESTDKTKLTGRPGPSPPLMEVQNAWQREDGAHFLVHLESYLPFVVPWTETWQTAAQPEESNEAKPETREP